jgi:hypothetical protein
MLKFNLNTSAGLSGFLKNLKRSFVSENMDIRQTKDSKLLHRAADAMGMENWDSLKHSMDELTGVQDVEPESEAPYRQAAKSTLDDLLDLNNAIMRGENEEELSDHTYGWETQELIVHFNLGSDRGIYFNVSLINKSYQDVVSARIVVRGFGDKSVLEIQGEELQQMTDLFEIRLMIEVENLLWGDA